MPDFKPIYDDLRRRLVDAAPHMIVAADGPTGITLHAPWANPLKPKEPMWFGSVQIKKTYVSVHLMPVYSHPSLEAAISPDLAKRRQGKSCFNFKAADGPLFDQMETVMRASAEAYAAPFDLPAR